MMVLLGALIGVGGSFTGVRAFSAMGAMLMIGGIVRILSANAK